MELLAASAEHAAASDRRMGPAALRWRRRVPGTAAYGAGEFAGAGEARFGGKPALAGAAPRNTAAKGTRSGFCAGGSAPAATGGSDELGDGGRQGLAAGAGVRGPALGGS